MRILSFILCAAMILSLAGCANNSPEKNVFTGDENVGTDGENIPGETDDENPDEQSPAEDGEDAKEAGLTPIYDSSAVLEAYRSGDESALDEKQKTVLDAAKKAIEEFSRPDMSEENLVIAAHDWLTTHCTYDTGMLGLLKDQTPDSENPYGVFTEGMGICMGYTTTFQLFMDMLGIESMIVRGEAYDEEHAWNLVNLDGQWYHVDCTWDDFVPDDDPNRPAFHLYVLVPDSAMEMQHIWKHEDYPAATAEDRIFLKTHGKYAQTQADCIYALNSAIDMGLDYAELMSDTMDNFVFNGTGVTYWPTDLGKYYVAVFWLSDAV